MGHPSVPWDGWQLVVAATVVVILIGLGFAIQASVAGRL